MRLGVLLVLAVAACAPPRRPEFSRQELAERSRAFTEGGSRRGREFC